MGNPMIRHGYNKHGTPIPAHAHGCNGYTNYRCRCDVCRQANSSRNLRMRVLRAGKVPPGRHGIEAVYFNYGCRCDLCRKAHADAQRARRMRRSA